MRHAFALLDGTFGSVAVAPASARHLSQVPANKVIDGFEISYDLDASAYAAIIRKRLFRSPRLFVNLALVIVLGAWLYFRGYPAYGVALSCVLIAAFMVRWWMAPAKWLSTAPYMTERKTIRITPERLCLETKSVKSEFPWTHFIAWNESVDYFMLDLTPNGFCSAIPKACMNPEQQTLFRSWAAAKLPKYPKRLTRG
jgi:hypothetical protein